MSTGGRLIRVDQSLLLLAIVKLLLDACCCARHEFAGLLLAIPVVIAGLLAV